MRSITTLLLFIVSWSQVLAKDVDPLRPLTKPLAETVKQHPKKAVLIIFSADWDLSGSILRRFLKQQETLDILNLTWLEVYFADCTNTNGIGAVEMKRHGEKAIPVSAALKHPNGQITFTKLNLTSVKTLQKDLLTLINKNAQQDAAPN